MNKNALRGPQLFGECPPLVPQDIWAAYQEDRARKLFLRTSLFAGLDGDARAEILHRLGRLRLSSGQTLAQPGEKKNLVALLLSGNVLLEQVREKQAARLYRLFPGEHLAVLSAFDGRPTRTRIVATQASELLLLGHPQLELLAQSHPSIRRLSAAADAAFPRRIDFDVHCSHGQAA